MKKFQIDNKKVQMLQADNEIRKKEGITSEYYVERPWKITS